MTWEHLLDSVMQSIQFTPAFCAFRTLQGKSICHAIKMMSDDDADDCDGLFDHLL